MSRRKGTRLAVSLPPRWPRWGTLLLSTFVTLIFVVLILAYFWVDDGDPNHLLPQRIWMVGILLGLPGLFCVIYWVRDAAIWLVAGETRVEIDAEPLHPGDAVRYFVYQSRDHSILQRLEARILCRSKKGRMDPEVILSIPLCGTTADRQGRRAQVEGTAQIPADARPTLVEPALEISWAVEVKAFFRARRVFLNDHPFEVKEKPPAGA